MVNLLTFDENIDRDSVDIWKEFDYVFQRINGFITYEKIAAAYLIHGTALLIKDNIQHAEFRTFFGPRFYDLQGNKLDLEGYVKILERVEAGAKAMDPDFTINLIQQSLRFLNQSTIEKDMLLAHQYRQKYPRWIRGF